MEASNPSRNCAGVALNLGQLERTRVMQPAARIDVISDAICPWCYIGKSNLDQALATLAAEGLRFSVQWHPYQLNPDMPAEGVERAAYRAAKFGDPERVRQIDARVTEAAAGAGLQFHLDRITRTPNTIAAHRLGWFAERSGLDVQNKLVAAMFRGYFVDGFDIGDTAVLVACATEAGIDPEAAKAFLDSDDGRVQVLASDQMFRNSGLNGVPTFVMNRHVLFSGAVPADAMAQAFRSAWKVLQPVAA
jgi:predicted DsbA family dithiol-disulfide isomerase